MAAEGQVSVAEGKLSPRSEDLTEAEEWSIAVPAQIVYHLFEDPGFFQRGIFGRKGQSKALGATLFVVSHTIISVVNMLILVSTVAVCLETVPEFSQDPHKNPGTYALWNDRWNALEVTCVTAFTCDLLVRLFGALAAGPQVLKLFFTDWMNLVDVLAIAPFYLALMEADIVDLRFLRVVRLVRILKALPGGRNVDRIGLITEIITSSYQALLVPVFFAMLALICLSSITYYLERAQYRICTMTDGTIVEGWVPDQNAIGYYDDSGGFYLGKQHPLFPPALTDGFAYNMGCMSDHGCACPGTLSYVDREGTVWSSELFSSIPNVFWWCIVTFTTVGYGDINPRTNNGQQLTAITMMVGIFFLSMPISIVGDSFSRSWNRFTTNRDKMQLKTERRDKAAERKVQKAAGEEIVTLEGPHDALNNDILGMFVRSKKRLSTLRPLGEDGERWDDALGMLKSCENTWTELYREIQAI